MINIHDYLKEHGFKMTGEFRTLGNGDYYLRPALTGESADDIGRWDSHFISLCKYLILKKLPQTYEFDGQTFEAPEGYVFERVGLVGPSDVGKYGLDAPEAPYPPQEITRKSLEWRDCIYVILRKDAQ